MKAISFDGVFWLADNPGNTSVGRFSYTSQKGTELDIIGTFHSTPHIPTEEAFTIHSMGENNQWTIFRARQTLLNITMPGFNQEQYHSQLVLKGKNHLDESHLQQVTSVHLQMQHLLDWVNQTGLRYEVEPRAIEDSSPMRAEDFEHRIIFTPPSTITQDTQTGVIEIEFPYTSSASGFTTADCQIKQLCSLGFRWNSPTSIEEAFKVAHSFQDLLALSIGTPPLIQKVSITFSNIEGTFELLASDLDKSLFEDSRSHIGDWIFSLDSFGGLGGVVNWFNISQQYHVAINTLLSVKYTPNLYLENQFINIMIAAEAFERVRCEKTGRLKLIYILQCLVEYAGDVFANLVKDTQNWINQVERMRHEIVHSHSMGDIEVSKLILYTDSSYWLIMICLLKECHVDDYIFDRIYGIQEFQKIRSEFG